MAAVSAAMQEGMVSRVRAILVVCEAQGWWGGTPVAFDGRQLPANAAQAWRGTWAELRQQKEHLAQPVKTFLAAHTSADQEGETSSPAAPPSAPDHGPEPMQRVEQPAARLEKVWTATEPKRGKRGTAWHSHVTDHDAAQRPTAPGVMQGDNGPALVEANPQVSRPAAAFGNGQAEGPVAPLREGAQGPGTAMGRPQHDVEGQRFSAASTDHREAQRTPCV